MVDQPLLHEMGAAVAQDRPVDVGERVGVLSLGQAHRPRG